MKTPFGNERDHDDETFRTLLSVAHCPEPVPPAALVERVQEELRARTAAVSPQVGGQPKRWRVGPVWIATTALAAAALVMIVTLIIPREATWAQVATAVRAKPWILFTYPSDDGQKHQEWISISRDMSGRRDGDRFSFRDHRLKLVTLYEPMGRTIIRATETPREWKMELDRALDRVLEAIFRGDEKLQSPIPEVELASQQRKELERDGRKWLAYELTLRHVEEEKEQTSKMTFLVDPATRLPQLLLMTKPHKEKGAEEFAVEISYPDPGPVDIYDLGAPRDSKVIDKLPTDDVQRLVAGVKASAERFGDYVVLNVNSAPDAPWYVGTPMAVWRKGTKSRQVMGVVDTSAPPMKAPDEGVPEHQWWKKRWSELFHVPADVDDGKTVWTNDAHPEGMQQTAIMEVRSWRRADWPQPKWHIESDWAGGSVPCVPLFHVYPEKLTVDYPLEAKVDSHPTDGPENTIRLTVGGKPAEPHRSTEDRMWIDPQRSYLIVRREMVGLDTSKTPPVETFKHTIIVEKMERSPRGIWYPTVMRQTSSWEENGQTKIHAAITRHYFDFDAKFSDDVFKPVARLESRWNEMAWRWFIAMMRAMGRFAGVRHRVQWPAGDGVFSTGWTIACRAFGPWGTGDGVREPGTEVPGCIPRPLRDEKGKQMRSGRLRRGWETRR